MILNEIQKAIISSSSLRIKTEIGFIEIYKGEILPNAFEDMFLNINPERKGNKILLLFLF